MKKTLTIFALTMLCFLPIHAQKEEISDYDLIKAIEMFEMGYESDGMEYLDQHLQKNPKSCAGYVLRAGMYAQQKKYGPALMDINNAIKYWNKGDRVKKYSGLPYPVVIGRRASVAACPACGNISAEGSEVCTECACILRSDGDFRETY